MKTKESEVDSDVHQDIFRPTSQEFANFAHFVKNLEKRGQSFALVFFFS